MPLEKEGVNVPALIEKAERFASFESVVKEVTAPYEVPAALVAYDLK